ncbi:MAG: DRTGG domain-containing protein [Clostridia bacterium]|jgi:predicted transcriptional regulator
MVVKDLVTILKAIPVTCEIGFCREIQYILCCDHRETVSDIAVQDSAWITVDVNNDSIDLAVKKLFACIIVPYDIKVDRIVTEYAKKEGIPVLLTSYNSYKVCYKMYEAFKERT